MNSAFPNARARIAAHLGTPEERLATRQMMERLEVAHPGITEAMVEMIPLAAYEARHGIEGPGLTWCGHFERLLDQG